MTLRSLFSALRLALAAASVLCIAVPAAAGPIYDASSDFDTVNNPSQINGATFSYGMSASLGSAFTLFSDHVANGTLIGYDVAAGGGLPLLAENTSASAFSSTQNGSTITVQPMQLDLHPSSSGQYSVLRFTAPAAGSYSYSTTFNAADSHPTTTDVHVLIDSTLDHAAFLNLGGGGNTASFTGLVSLPLNGTIDFAVGNGGNGFGFDSTGLFATVTSVPEPSAIVLFGIGAMVLASVSRRTLRKQA